MKPLPYVEPIKDLDALISIFSEPEKFAVRLKEWQVLRDEIDLKLTAYGEWKKVEAVKADIEARLTEAKDVRRAADEYLRDQKGKAQKIVDEATAYRNSVMDEFTQRHVALDKQEKTLEAFQGDLEKERTLLEKRRDELANAEQRTLKVAQDAERAKADYEARLKAIEAAAKGPA